MCFMLQSPLFFSFFLTWCFIRATVYPINYANGFAVIYNCFVIVILLISINVIYLYIFYMVTSLALGQSYDCPSASEVTLKDMGKIDIPDHNKIQQSTSHVHMASDHDDIIKWKHFLRYWPFVRGIHQSLVNSSHKGKWCGALMFSLICVWINGWVNNREAGDLRCYHAHYDVTVMCVVFSSSSSMQLVYSGIWILIILIGVMVWLL